MWIEPDGSIAIAEIERPLRSMDSATLNWLLQFRTQDVENALDFVYDEEERFLGAVDTANERDSLEAGLELPKELFPAVLSDAHAPLVDSIAQHLAGLPAIWKYDGIRLWLGVLDDLTKRRERFLARVRSAPRA